MTPGSKMTPAQGLHGMRQESLRLLVGFAESTRDAANHRWKDTERRDRALHLISSIKRDLEEFNAKLRRITSRHDKLSGKVLAHPHHPELLRAGGDYLSFIEEASAVVTPILGELISLLSDELDESNKEPTE